MCSLKYTLALTLVLLVCMSSLTSAGWFRDMFKGPCHDVKAVNGESFDHACHKCCEDIWGLGKVVAANKDGSGEKCVCDNVKDYKINEAGHITRYN